MSVSAQYAGRALGVRDADKDNMPLDDPANPGKEYFLGDVTMDGRTDASDARLALRAAARLETLSPLQQKLADTDGDGLVKAGDARTILRIAAKLDEQPDKKFSSAS